MSWLKIAVVGGVNLDILGSPTGDFRLRDSVIGNVRFSCGGVGHNIAARAVRTGADVSLFTVLGDDRHAEWILESCHEEGIRMNHAIKLHGNSSVYLAIHDSEGDMLTAVNDMSLLDRFSSQLLEKMLPEINHSDVCVIDANLPENSLAYLSHTLVVPSVCDPVSIEKSSRVFCLLDRLYAIKPNIFEARSMTGRETPEDCAQSLISRGVRMVFISLGKDGLYYSDGNRKGYLRPSSLTSRPQTGAGDALTAGIACGVGQKLGVLQCAELGMDEAARFLGS